MISPSSTSRIVWLNLPRRLGLRAKPGGVENLAAPAGFTSSVINATGGTTHRAKPQLSPKREMHLRTALGNA
jgi:hypothetical protein